ncbi:MAG: hypothetical protein ACLPKI_22710 [Streptosporangiaceae bacterium]
MKIGQVIAAHQGHGPGRVHLGRAERGAVQVQPLDDPDTGQLGDARAVAAADRAEQDGDLLPVVGGQFLDHPVGQGVVPAHDEVIRVLGGRAGGGRHYGI